MWKASNYPTSVDLFAPIKDQLYMLDLSRPIWLWNMSNAQPIHLRWAHEKLLSGASATSSDVLDLCLVDDHPTVSMLNTEKEKLLTDDINQRVKLCCTEHFLSLGDQDYMEKIREIHDRLEMVKNIVRPGCSYEVLNAALSFMSSLATILSEMPQKLHASL